MTQFSSAMDVDNPIISHNSSPGFNLEKEQERLKSAPTLTLPLEEELELLNQVVGFELGRFLLENKGLNGYWTAFAILKGPKLETYANPLEQWVYQTAPVVRATQERFKIFQNEIKSRLSSGMTIASLPCGGMDDLLTLNYEGLSDIHLVGIDLDPKSIELAGQNASTLKHPVKVSFFTQNAWEITVHEEYNMLTSNGLNIYEPNDEKVVKLYEKMHQTLKPGGIFITSFLTPPPILSSESTWRNFNPSDVIKQKALFSDVLQVKWQSFRTESQTRLHLEKAGFKVLDVIYDTQGMFPTIIAEKQK